MGYRVICLVGLAFRTLRHQIDGLDEKGAGDGVIVCESLLGILGRSVWIQSTLKKG